jgi:hypothetical protein
VLATVPDHRVRQVARGLVRRARVQAIRS